MKCLVTGATGFIGSNLVKVLLEQKAVLHILVRSKHKISDNIRKQVTVFEGDLHQLHVLDAAMKDCDYLFHLAGFAGIWSKNKSHAVRINAEGTRNVLDAALRNKIKRVVFTSTAGTFPPSVNGELVDENAQLQEKYLTEYEYSKRQAELICEEFVGKGLDIVIVNPTRVYGPGVLNKSNSVTILIKKYINGSWRFIPGNGNQTGNYVFIDDVVRGHILALEKGKTGERYILGGENITFNGLFDTIAEAGSKRYHLFHIPLFAILAFAYIELFLSDFFGKAPLITPAWVKRYNQDRILTSRKATVELKYHQILLADGIKKTIIWLNSNKLKNGKTNY